MSAAAPHAQPLPATHTVVTSWRGVLEALGPLLETRGPHPDAVLNTLRHMYYRARCGVAVAVRGGRVAAFVPFANTAYTNTWSPRAVLCLGLGRGVTRDVAAYAAAKAAALRRPPEAMLPLEAWWTNGGVACNVMPSGGWGTGFLAELQAMVTAAAQEAVDAGAPLPDAVVFLNKRDYPAVRVDGRDPAVRFVGSRDVPLVCAAYVPVFSWYVGSDFADAAMPVVDDWVCAVGGRDMPAAAWDALREEVPTASRPPVAVFRGTATGPGDWARNPRIRLVKAGEARPDVLDAAITGANATRDRVSLGPDGDTVEVRFVDAAGLPRRAGWEPLVAQARRARFLVYVDGHSAASRYGTLMRTGSVIIRVASAQAADCGDTWLFRHGGLVGLPFPGGDVAAVAWGADHLLVAAPEDVPDCVAWANAALGIEGLSAMAANAAAKAPTRAAMVAWWQGALRDAGSAQAGPGDGDGAGAAAWFTPADSRYASLAVDPRLEVRP
jgi:hypothetical protein